MSAFASAPPATHPQSPEGATRERILAAAAYSLSRDGYARTRLQEIAGRAGVRPPAVYYYFDSREQLITEVLREGQVRVRLHVERALADLEPDTPAIDRVATAVEAHLRVELELSDFARAVVRTAGQLPDHLHRQLEPDVEAYHALWRSLLADLRDQGRLDPRLDVQVARMLVIGALNWSVEWATERPIDDVVDQTQQLVRRALSPF
jgi:AcrR family transcriptional regulator